MPAHGPDVHLQPTEGLGEEMWAPGVGPHSQPELQCPLSVAEGVGEAEDPRSKPMWPVQLFPPSPQVGG